jgi:hypothetical protein
MDRARGKVDSAWPATLSALVLYRRGECKEALQVLEGLNENDKGAFQQTTRMFLLAELPDGGKQAMEAYKEGEGRYQGTALLFWHTLLCLLGDQETAKAKYQDMKIPQALATVRQRSYEKLLAYNRGEIDALALLNSVEDSKYHECNAYYFIAMSLLAGGDRDGARKHFAACVATGCFDFDASDWSRTFLARMNQDPNWLLWIPPKKP